MNVSTSKYVNTIVRCSKMRPGLAVPSLVVVSCLTSVAAMAFASGTAAANGTLSANELLSTGSSLHAALMASINSRSFEIVCGVV